MSGAKELEYFDTNELMHELCRRYHGCIIISVRPGEKGSYTEFLLRKSENTNPLMATHMLADAIKMNSLSFIIDDPGT